MAISRQPDPYVPRRSRVLFFSRGKGRGHAVPDIALSGEMLAVEPDLDIVFVSYSVGAITLKAAGGTVIDLGLPEDPPLWDLIAGVINVLQTHEADLVVSHEEFSVVPLAKIFDFPIIFITDWFGDAKSLQMHSLRYADHIIMMDEEGYWAVPEYLNGRVEYTGTVLRPLGSVTAENARVSLGIPAHATVILVAPGGSNLHCEQQAPVFDLILSAFDTLETGEKRLIYIARDDERAQRTQAVANRADVQVIAPHDSFTTTMMASDLVITTGNRTPILEAHALGIPSISLSFGLNPIDDRCIERVRTNTALRARGLSPGALGRHILRAIRNGGKPSPTLASETSLGRLATAERLIVYLREGLSRATVAPCDEVHPVVSEN